MPKIAEIREIDGEVWARVEMRDGSPIQFLTRDEVDENLDREMHQLDEIERLGHLAIDLMSLLEEMPVKHPQQAERRAALRLRFGVQQTTNETRWQCSTCESEWGTREQAGACCNQQTTEGEK
jgi:hypothetical protein